MQVWTADILEAWIAQILENPVLELTYRLRGRPPVRAKMRRMRDRGPGEISGSVYPYGPKAGELWATLPRDRPVEKWRMLTFVTHELAHLLAPDEEHHGEIWRVAWCALVTVATERRFQWPTVMGKRMSYTRTWNVVEEEIRRSWRRPAWSRPKLLRKLDEHLKR